MDLERRKLIQRDLITNMGLYVGLLTPILFYMANKNIPVDSKGWGAIIFGALLTALTTITNNKGENGDGGSFRNRKSHTRVLRRSERTLYTFGGRKRR